MKYGFKNCSVKSIHKIKLLSSTINIMIEKTVLAFDCKTKILCLFKRLVHL